MKCSFNLLPHVETLHKLFKVVHIDCSEYGDCSGLVRRIGRRGNTKAGDVAGNRWYNEQSGEVYWQVGVGSKRYRVHRIIFKMVTFVDPGEFEIDHIDRNPDNNNVSNLRLALHPSLQVSNRGLQRNNTSGVTGVSYHAPSNKWAPHLTVDGIQIRGDYSICFKEACSIRNNLLRVHQPPDWEKRLIDLGTQVCSCSQCSGHS